MLTINWKKGKDKLIFEDEDESPSPSPANKSSAPSSVQFKSKKQGHKKFQVYTQFLKGEEKEIHEKKVEKKR